MSVVLPPLQIFFLSKTSQAATALEDSPAGARAPSVGYSTWRATARRSSLYFRPMFPPSPIRPEWLNFPPLFRRECGEDKLVLSTPRPYSTISGQENPVPGRGRQCRIFDLLLSPTANTPRPTRSACRDVSATCSHPHMKTASRRSRHCHQNPECLTPRFTIFSSAFSY